MSKADTIVAWIKSHPLLSQACEIQMSPEFYKALLEANPHAEPLACLGLPVTFRNDWSGKIALVVEVPVASESL